MSVNETVLLKLINDERNKRNLSPFVYDNRLSKSAQDRAQNIKAGKEEGFIDHIRNYTGSDYTVLGEIYGMGSDNENIINNFFKCSGNHSYLFNPRYTHIGINVQSTESVVKLVTAHFGGPRLH